MLANPFFHLLKPETVELSLTPRVSKIHIQSIRKSCWLYFWIFPESDHFLQNYRLLQIVTDYYCTAVVQTSTTFLQNYCSGLLTGLPAPTLSLLQSQGLIKTQVSSYCPCCSESCESQNAHDDPWCSLTSSPQPQQPPICASNIPAHFLLMTFALQFLFPEVSLWPIHPGQLYSNVVFSAKHAFGTLSKFITPHTHTIPLHFSSLFFSL